MRTLQRPSRRSRASGRSKHLPSRSAVSTSATGPSASGRPSRSSRACVVCGGSSSRWWVTRTVASRGWSRRSSSSAPISRSRPGRSSPVAGSSRSSSRGSGSDWPTRLRRAAVTDVYEVRMAVEVHAARLAARRRTPDDIAALRAALEGRRAAATADDAAFVDADIAFHATVIASARNPVLADLFTEFTPVLREGLIELLTLTGLRAHDPNTGDDAHEELVRAVADGDAEGAAEVLRGELEDPFALTGKPE
ncbi:FadR/GntR family transcriptional regulator [Streptomyces sp. NPDC056948]|uniref:FadR/GntR family transcriptional regulator n=1 Tax=Streptomyces sp. NPDC056948 TaxID=3345975 RepID=UPI0036388B03